MSAEEELDLDGFSESVKYNRAEFNSVFNNIRPMRIWVDMDGVLADFISLLLHRYNIYHGTTVQEKDIVQWDISKVCPNWDSFVSEHDFWQNIPDYVEAAGLISALRITEPDITSNFQIGILTGSRPGFFGAASRGKIQWCKDRNIPLSNFVITTNKNSVLTPQDILIEDCLETVEKAPCSCILVKRPWNSITKEQLDKLNNNFHRRVVYCELKDVASHLMKFISACIYIEQPIYTLLGKARKFMESFD